MKKKVSSNIEWRQVGRDLIAFENGQMLDQPAQELPSNVSIQMENVVLIGLGSGFLLQKIQELHPNVNLTVIECREALVSQAAEKLKSVHFVMIESLKDLEMHPQLKEFMSPSFQKILNKESLGAQKSFLQEIFWYLNLRTADSLKSYFNIVTPVDDRWLVNAKQLFEFIEPQQIPFELSEVLTIKELVK